MALISGIWRWAKKLVITTMSSSNVDGARRPKQYGKKNKAVAEVSVGDDGEASALSERDANRQPQLLDGPSEEEKREKKRKQKKKKKMKSPFDKEMRNYLEPVLKLGGHRTTFHEFAEVLDEQSIELKKVAEGSYAEVFELKRGGGTAILKLVPIKPERGETVMLLELSQMTSVPSLAAELITLQRLHDIPGFSQFINFQILHGRQTGPFISASKAYRETGGHSEFPDPSVPYAYDEDQLWCAIEMSHGGLELEKEVIEHPLVIWDVFWGVCFALAKAEVEIKFEHRDLHPSNVCIVIDREKAQRCLLEDERVKPSEEATSTAIRVGFTGITSTLIDYSLSRTSASQIGDVEGRTSNHTLPMDDIAPDLEQQLSIFHLIDPALQFSVYRWMRSVVCFDDRLNLELGHMDKNEIRFQEETSSRRRKQKVETKPIRGWETYEPLTNVFWLHYLLSVLLDRFRSQSDNRGWRFPLPEGTDYLLKVEEFGSKGVDALRCLELIDLQLSREIRPDKSKWMVDSASSLVTVAYSLGFIEIDDYLEG